MTDLDFTNTTPDDMRLIVATIDEIEHKSPATAELRERLVAALAELESDPTTN